MMEFPCVVTDQMNHEVRITSRPSRIISLVPSQTELLFDLGLNDEVVGITKFCIHPEEWFRHKTLVGGTKQYHFDKIDMLKPDLILGNKEENDEEQIRELQKKYPVWMSDIQNLTQALDMIEKLGALTGTSVRAEEISLQIRKEFADLENDMSQVKPMKAAYLIWKNPIMAAGSDTFIESMMQRLQLRNVISAGRYPETTIAELRELTPDVLLLSSEPYPFKESHIREFEQSLPETSVLLVDGEFFSWYGSRLLKAPSYFKELMAQIKQCRL